MTIAFGKLFEEPAVERRTCGAIDRIQPIFLINTLMEDDGPTVVALFEELVEAADTDEIAQHTFDQLPRFDPLFGLCNGTPV